MTEPIKKIDIIRKYEKVVKSSSGEFVIKIGQDNQGRIFGFCGRCNINMTTLTDFDFKMHTIKRSLYCNKCHYRQVL